MWMQFDQFAKSLLDTLLRPVGTVRSQHEVVVLRDLPETPDTLLLRLPCVRPHGCAEPWCATSRARSSRMR